MENNGVVFEKTGLKTQFQIIINVVNSRGSRSQNRRHHLHNLIERNFLAVAIYFQPRCHGKIHLKTIFLKYLAAVQSSIAVQYPYSRSEQSIGSTHSTFVMAEIKNTHNISF